MAVHVREVVYAEAHDAEEPSDLILQSPPKQLLTHGDVFLHVVLIQIDIYFRLAAPSRPLARLCTL